MPNDRSSPPKSKRTSLWHQWLLHKKGLPFPFQQQTWDAYLKHQSGLVHAPTGQGKTYSVFGGPILEWLSENPDPLKWPKNPDQLRVLWITPLRALANDTAEALQLPIRDLQIPWSVELRTGDTSSATRQRQRKRLPTVLITTPESLSLLLSHEETRDHFHDLRAVIVDEWHELMSSKRGVQTELCLARLRTWRPNLRTWGLSATLGNLQQAMEVLLGTHAKQGQLITANIRKKFEIQTLLPSKQERFPWSGHSGVSLINEVIQQIEKYQTTLLFTNTRSQTEIWYKALLAKKPEWENVLQLHHGSIDRSVREQVEAGLRSGQLRCVVCTGSLDLGVDFSPVEQVIQVGGPKGVARILQRAGRSGHQPGAVSRIIGVPAHALELIEFAAARDAVAAGEIEARLPLENPFDVLLQHLVTIAIGGGFYSHEMLQEVRSTYAYQNLTKEEWHWILEFLIQGGKALKAYPQFQRLQEVDGKLIFADPKLARFHRLSIGTISSDASVHVKMMHGQRLGSVEEAFIARIKPGESFTFSGRLLELVRVKDMVATVRVAKKSSRIIPQWLGGYMPLSSQLADAVRDKLEDASEGKFLSKELKALEPVLKIQQAWSHLPNKDDLLLELTRTREGYHCFIFLFAGRLAHEGIAHLVAHRLAKQQPRSLTLCVNDYGIALTSPTSFSEDPAIWSRLLGVENLEKDLRETLNEGELAKRRFRNIARIVGLVFGGYPGQPKTMKQIQASSGLFYDVFKNYDPGNLLLEQARREVLRHELDFQRLQETLNTAQQSRIVIKTVPQLAPLSFPLWATWVQGHVSSETWADRVQRMADQLDRAVG